MAKKNTDNQLEEEQEDTQEAPAQPREGLFRIEMKYNDSVHVAENDDVIAGIMSIKPKVLKTRVIFHIEKDGKQTNLLVHRLPALQLFRNRLAMTVFTNRIILK